MKFFFHSVTQSMNHIYDMYLEKKNVRFEKEISENSVKLGKKTFPMFVLKKMIFFKRVKIQTKWEAERFELL